MHGWKEGWGSAAAAEKSGAVAIQNWNCSITSYSDHAPHPSSPLAIFGHQSFLDICTRCREKGRAGRGGWPIEKWNFGSLDEKLKKWRISPNSAPPAVEADGDPSDGFAPPSDGQNFSWWDGEAKILTLENLMDVPGMVFIWGIRRTRWKPFNSLTF